MIFSLSSLALAKQLKRSREMRREFSGCACLVCHYVLAILGLLWILRSFSKLTVYSPYRMLEILCQDFMFAM